MENAGHRTGNGSPLEAPELDEAIERAKAQLHDLDTRARRFIQDQPLIAVGAALAVGYVLGRLLRPR